LVSFLTGPFKQQVKMPQVYSYPHELKKYCGQYLKTFLQTLFFLSIVS
jgi:hypothetical protein